MAKLDCFLILQPLQYITKKIEQLEKEREKRTSTMQTAADTSL